jgi:hypothetical protein
MVGTRNNDTANLNGFTSSASATTVALACPTSGWSIVTLPIAVDLTVSQNKYLAVRLVTSSTSSRVLVNYDSASASSVVVLPVAP